MTSAMWRYQERLGLDFEMLKIKILRKKIAN